MALKGKSTVNMNPQTEAPAATLKDHSEPVADAAQAEGDAPWEEASAPQPAAPTRATSPVASSGQVPAPAGKAGIGSMAILQNDGFGDLDNEIGFGSFPIIKLDKAKFVVGDEEVDSFQCVLLQSRDKWIWKADDDNLFYSYDNVHDTANRLVEDRVNEWVAQGFSRDKIENRKYKEVVVKMVNTKLAGTLALLSIPPASVTRIAGYRAEIGLAHGKQLSQVITECIPGAKIQVNPKISFYPWNFKYVANVE